MKKIILLMLFLLMGTVNATDLSVLYVDTIGVLDTVLGSADRDTVYTGIISLEGASRIQMFFQVLQPTETYLPLNKSNDSMALIFEHSFDKINWREWALASVFDTTNPGTWETFAPAMADSVTGPFGRGKFIYKDSSVGTSPDSLDFVRALKFNLFLSIIK